MVLCEVMILIFLPPVLVGKGAVSPQYAIKRK
jgi:hypothetical protein